MEADAFPVLMFGSLLTSTKHQNPMKQPPITNQEAISGSSPIPSHILPSMFYRLSPTPPDFLAQTGEAHELAGLKR